MRWIKTLRSTGVRSCSLGALVAASAAISAGAQTPSTTPPPAVSRPAPASQPPRFLVVLDAAHGGDDFGGRLADEPEKSFALALSVRLRSLLAARGIQVVTTRESDVTMDAAHRAEIANRAKAQACLSLHASETGFGIHLFASSLPPVPASRIPAWQTAQAAWVTQSLALAGVLNSALLHAGLPVTLGRTALPEVDSMTCPAIAVEVAPNKAADASSATDLDVPAYQARVAEALAAALLEWKTEVQQP
ncbi:MAG TPA: N-acetylmuramoyl-L-alanine amidase [Terracidiphilus sp.]|jgi:N-acetylmuramoyl-L-alanine amidase